MTLGPLDVNAICNTSSVLNQPATIPGQAPTDVAKAVLNQPATPQLTKHQIPQLLSPSATAVQQFASHSSHRTVPYPSNCSRIDACRGSKLVDGYSAVWTMYRSTVLMTVNRNRTCPALARR